MVHVKFSPFLCLCNYVSNTCFILFGGSLISLYSHDSSTPLSILDSPTKFKNIGYLAMGYDVFKGNPHSTGKFDSGFKLDRVFSLTYEDGNTTPDGEHLVPDHVSANNQPSCSFSFSAQTITEVSSYSESLYLDASVEGGGWGASFSASAGYKSAKETTSSHEYRLYSSKAKCSAYAAYIRYKHAKLSESFKETVEDLPTDTKGESEYHDLIDFYGTHFVRYVEMGGRYGYRSEMSNTKAVELSSQGINVKAAAGYSGMVSVHGSITTDFQKEQAKEFDEARESVEQFFVGGGPPGDETWNEYKWASSVAENPLPIRYKLVPIESLLTSEYFPENDQINLKRQMLNHAMTEYCKQISSEPQLCGKSAQDPLPLITIKIVSSFTLVHDYYLKNLKIWAPVLENPYERLAGTLITSGDSKSPSKSFVMNAQTANSDVVRPAIDWPSPLLTIPKCPEGFSSISDFYSHDEDYKNKLVLPCFANRCLADCLFEYMPENRNVFTYYVYKNGYPILGGNFVKEGSSFHRYTEDVFQPKYNPWSLPQNKCLTYTCLEF